MMIRDLLLVALWVATAVLAMTPRNASIGGIPEDEEIALPKPETSGGMALAEAIDARRSVRDFELTPLSRSQVGQLCWAAQGITDAREGLRAAPSAGALYPMSVYVVDAGAIFEYLPAEHVLRRLRSGDVRADLQAAALRQSCVGEAPLCLVITMDVGRIAPKYGEWAERYCLMEAGHIAQNVLLQAKALGLGAVPVGAFDDDRVAAILRLPDSRKPVYLVPLGTPGKGQ